MKKTGIIVAIILIFLSCEHGFIGLGDRVDIDSPQITIGQYSDGTPISNADYVRGQIILSGTVADDVGVSAVNLTIVDTATSAVSTGTATVDYSAMTWSYSIDTTSFIDGEKDITIEVLDTSSTPKSDTIQRLLFFDNTAPLVVVQSMGGYGSASSDADIPVSGDAYDPFRIKSVEISLDSGSGSVDAISPTSGPWSSVLRSSGTGNYSMTIVATDYAGNVSEGIYHIYDIQTANDNTFISVKDIYDIREGTLVQGAGLMQAHLQSGALLLSELPVSIDLSADEPQVAISNPDPNALPSENVLAGNAKAIGSITDDDGIDVSTIEININDTGWVAVDNTIGSGLFVKWDHDLSAVGAGGHSLKVRADDIYGVSKETASVNFSINLGAPEIAITSPSIGDYLDSGDFTISGTADDTTGGVNWLDISLDNGSSWVKVSSFTEDTGISSVAWNHGVTGQPDGNMLIKVRASDDGSAWSYSNLQAIVDTEFPTNTILYPGNNSYVNGLVEIRGASSDNNQLAQVEVRIGDVDPWIVIPEEERYNWTLSFNSLDYENSSDATETSSGSGVWDLNIFTRITDIAGNVTQTSAGDHVIKIDNSLDRPTVNIISPYNDQSIGGAVLISGTSFDDDGPVYGVYMQIDVNTLDGGTPDFADSVTLSDPIDFDGTGPNAPVTTIDETAWYLLSGKNPWSVEMNGNGELYSTGAGHTGDLYIRIKAIDKDGGVDSISGEYEELHIKMDDTVPYFSNVLPASDEYVKGSFVISGDVFDDRNIENLEISYNGGAQYHDIIRNGIIEAAYGGGTVTSSYSMNIPIDTSNVPDVGSLTSDTLSIRLKVTDDTFYQTLHSLRYYVDNTLPTGTSSDFNDINGNSSSAVISGTANDSGTVNGISHIEAYLVRDIGGTKYFYNPRNNDDTIVVSTMDINGTVHEYPNGAGYADYMITIDSTSETLGGANSDSDGIAEELNVGINYEWKYMFDSENIPDGSVELHYVVVDNAGNMNHYENTGFIRNHAPVIESIALGTDLNGINGVEASEESTFGPGSFGGTDFTGRNDSLKITVNLEAGTGNAPLSYSVTYQGGANLITGGAEAVIDTSGYADVSSNGAEFLCTITDNAGLITTESIYLNIDNIDNISPAIEFEPLDAELSVPDTAGVKDGHIEERSWTMHDNGADNPGDMGNDVSDDDPDVSGRIILRGSAWDDQRIKSIFVWIDSDGDGTLDAGERLEVANEDTDGTLKSIDGDFTIDLETLTEISGHNISFSYEWDTAGLVNMTGNDIQIRLLAEDFNTTPNESSELSYPGAGYNLMTVDVVPYISDIERNPAMFDTFRSKYGKYQIQQDETSVKVKGFNLLSSGTNAAWISTNTTVNPAAVNSDSLVIDGSSTDRNLVVDFTSVTHSGWMRIIVNGIEAINNINDNSRAANIEDTNWTDDRYVNIWEVGDSFANSDDPEHPAMSLDASTDTLYGTWSNYAVSTAYYATTGTRTSIFNTYDPPEYTDVLIYSGDVHTVILENYYNGGSTWGNLASEINNGSYEVIERLGNNSSAGSDKSDGMDEMLYQFQNPRIAVTGTNTQYISYYDAYSKSLKYSIVTGGAATFTSDDHRTDGQTVVDGIDDYDDTPTDGDDVGEWSSIQIDPDDGFPVILYSDTTNKTMKIARGLNSQPVGTAQWNISDVLPANSFSGKYVTMKMDGNGDIHAVYYKTSTGDLIYMHASDIDGAGSYVFDDPVVIDSDGAVGSWCDIAFLNGKPVVSYLNSSMIGTFSGLKYAVYEGDGSSWDNADNWEYAVVPANTAVSDARASIEASTTAGWGAIAIGYGSSTFDLVYLKEEE